MTKKELIRALEKEGCFDVDMTWSKKDLETRLETIKKANSMSLTELVAHIMNK